MGLERIRFKEIQEFSKKLKHIIWFILIAFAVIILRLFELQVVRAEKFRSLSDINSVRLVPLRAPRGIIYDRNGKILVRNDPTFTVSVIPADFFKKEGSIDNLSKLLKIKSEEIEEKLKDVRAYLHFKPVKIIENLSRETLSTIAEHSNDLTGVILQQDTYRYYKQNAIAVHVIGHVGLANEAEVVLYPQQYSYGDMIGRTGIESVYDASIRGKNGYRGIRVNAMGKELGVVFEREPVKGDDIILTLDKDIQEAAENVMKNKKGSVIVMDPKTGEILAMVSSPAFDLSCFNKGGISQEDWDKINNDPNKPLQNKAISGLYAMGSTFKPIVAIGGLEKKLIDESYKITCTGKITYKDQDFRCWEDKGHHEVDLYKAICESCDTYFYYLGLRLKVSGIDEYSLLFGLGSKSGIELAGEQEGLVPTPLWKERNRGMAWYPGNTIQLAIGQSYLLTTPLQMIQVYNLLANEGILYQPHLVKTIVREKGNQETPLVITRNIESSVSKNTWKIIKKALWKVVNAETGTGRAAKITGLDVCGKTASIQNPLGKEHASFIAFAPMDDPQVTVLVFIEHGEKGGGVAAPLVRTVLQAWANKYYFNQKKPAVPKS